MLEFLPGWMAAGGGFVLGLVVGSFLNVVILRLPLMLERDWRRECAELTGAEPGGQGENISLVRPGSHCPHCGASVRPWHNVPVLSYLWLRGRCADCNAPISARYPVVELLTGLLTAAVAWRFGISWEALAGALLTWSLVALAVIDMDHQILPDRITLPLVWTGLLFSLWGLFSTPEAAIAGAVGGYLSLWLVYQGFRLATGKEGMGFGDFKLLAVFGAWFGWQLLPQIVLVSSLVGATTGVTMMVTGRRERSQPIPFGPFLAVAGWIALMWGADINRAYLDLTGLG